MSLSKEKFDEIYHQVPRTCVEVLIETDDGFFVLSKRLIPPCVGMWHIPGGTLFSGERLNDAAIRIAKDELGVKINILKVIGVVNYLEIYKDIGHSVGVVFLCKLDNKQKYEFKGSYQGEEIKVFNINNIDENTISAHKKFLDIVKDRRKKLNESLVYLEE